MANKNIQIIKEALIGETYTLDTFAERILVSGNDWTAIRICNKLGKVGMTAKFSFDKCAGVYVIPVYLGMEII